MMYCEECQHEYYELSEGRIKCGQCGQTLLAPEGATERFK